MVSESVSMGIFEVAAIVAETRLGAVAGGWWVDGGGPVLSVRLCCNYLLTI